MKTFEPEGKPSPNSFIFLIPLKTTTGSLGVSICNNRHIFSSLSLDTKVCASLAPLVAIPVRASLFRAY